MISEVLLNEFLAIDRQTCRASSTSSSSVSRRRVGSTSTPCWRWFPVLDAERTHRDAMAFWLYSSGSTGSPKACVHLQHDMFVCAEPYAKGVLGMRASDRCFSAAKLFFAYGLGNALYMPFAVGATSILLPDAPAAPRVYEVIERYRPTLFFSVPTNFGMLLAHRRARAAGTSICHRCGTPCRRARRFQSRCFAASRNASASKFSTRLVPPSACTCSSPIAPARCGPDRVARWSPVTTRGSSMTMIDRYRLERSATC